MPCHRSRMFSVSVRVSTLESKPAVHMERLEPGQHGGFGNRERIPAFERTLSFTKHFLFNNRALGTSGGHGEDELSVVNILHRGHLYRRQCRTESRMHTSCKRKNG